MKVDYELDESYIKKILGHAPDSNVFESTYQHIADEDAAKAAEIAAGVRDPEPEESPLTPPTCPTCQEPLSDEARACPKCGTLFGPDAKAAQERVDDSVYQAKGQAEDEAEEEAVDALRDVLKDDPELARKIMDENPSLAGELLDG